MRGSVRVGSGLGLGFRVGPLLGVCEENSLHADAVPSQPIAPSCSMRNGLSGGGSAPGEENGIMLAMWANPETYQGHSFESLLLIVALRPFS